MPITVQALVCDGCGATADSEHVRERIARLEMATRFRPLHMTTLLLADSPPATLAEFFYNTEIAADAGDSAGGLQEAIFRAAGVDSAAKSPESCLAEFQRHGLYVAYVSECSMEGGIDVGRFADVVIRRIRFSYRPKSVLLIGRAAQLATHLFGAAIRAFSFECEAPGVQDKAGWTAYSAGLKAALERCTQP